MQGLPERLSAEEARAPACAALVSDMVELYSQLAALSHLDNAGDQEVRPRRMGGWVAPGALRERRACSMAAHLLR